MAGIGYECFANWLQPPGTVAKHLQKFGYDMTLLKVDALSSSEHNARQIRDAIMAMSAEAAAPRLVLIGYSKGAPDILRRWSRIRRSGATLRRWSAPPARLEGRRLPMMQSNIKPICCSNSQVQPADQATRAA